MTSRSKRLCAYAFDGEMADASASNNTAEWSIRVMLNIVLEQVYSNDMQYGGGGKDEEKRQVQQMPERE